MGLRTFTTLSSVLKAHLIKSSEEVLFPAGGSMVFPGNSSEGCYVQFNLLVGALLLPDVILNTRYKGRVSLLHVVLFKHMYWKCPVKGFVAIVRDPVSG